MARQKRKKWQVYFEDERPSRRRAPGREMPIGKQFVWGGRRWQIPAVYRCAEGLVLELVMQAPAGEIRAFMDRWGLGPARKPGPLQPGAAAFAAICALGKEDLCCDASSLYFELPEKLEWRMVFRHIPCENLQIKLR